MRHTLIIGGTRGSGKAFARLAIQSGEHVSAIGRRNISGSELGDPEIIPYRLDITDTNALRRLLPKICEERGMWTSLVFFQKFRGKGDNWLGEWQVSLNATKQIVDICVELIQESQPQQARAIVVIGSVAGSTIIADQPVGYHAAKAALEHMVRYWAVNLGPLGIRVNMISPHAVLKEESVDFYLNYTKLMDLYKRIIPLGRMGTSTEIAKTVRFLCSDDASYITGQNLLVDGGITLQMLEGPIRSVLGMER